MFIIVCVLHFKLRRNRTDIIEHERYSVAIYLCVKSVFGLEGFHCTLLIEGWIQTVVTKYDIIVQLNQFSI